MGTVIYGDDDVFLPDYLWADEDAGDHTHDLKYCRQQGLFLQIFQIKCNINAISFHIS
jgi:hypothetical protein